MAFEDSLWHHTAGDRLDAAARRCPATSTPTWRSSAPATPACGPPTTCTSSTRRCGSRSSKREIAGFGASGRNGGWCSALFPPASSGHRAARTGATRAVAMQRAMYAHGRRGRPGRRGRGHRRHYAKGGTISLARNAAAARAAPDELVEDERGCGLRRGRLRLLDGRGRARIARRDARARRAVHAALRRDPPGAARARARRAPSSARGVTIYEQHRAVELSDRHACVTDRGAGRAPRWSCAPPRATPPACRGERATLVPLYSLMIATEPLPARVWDEIGLRRARDVRRRPPPHHLRPAHRRRPDRVRRARRAVPLRLARSRPSSTATQRVHAALRVRCSSTCSRPSATRAITHHWGGAARRAARLVLLGRLRPRARARPGPAATSATAWRPPTSPAARSPT